MFDVNNTPTFPAQLAESSKCLSFTLSVSLSQNPTQERVLGAPTSVHHSDSVWAVIRRLVVVVVVGQVFC